MNKKETALQSYVNEQFGKIRGVMIDGVPYFVGKDVARALGYKNTKDTLSKHVDDEDKTRGYQIATPSGKQAMTLINESGLYSLILSSKLPKAKEFKRWVTSEVLPSIRKTGAYVVDKAYLKWLETRQHSTFTRKIETGVIKQFIEYAKAQGCTWDEKFFYSTISIWCNIGAGIAPKNGRDKTTIRQLNTIALLEGHVVKNILINGVAAGLHYTRIWAQVQQKVRLFCELTGRYKIDVQARISDRG